ncbi:MAG: hypothetical protein ACOYNH_07965 [Bacteroidia bacterium]
MNLQNKMILLVCFTLLFGKVKSNELIVQISLKTCVNCNAGLFMLSKLSPRTNLVLKYNKSEELVIKELLKENEFYGSYKIEYINSQDVSSNCYYKIGSDTIEKFELKNLANKIEIVNFLEKKVELNKQIKLENLPTISERNAIYCTDSILVICDYVLHKCVIIKNYNSVPEYIELKSDTNLLYSLIKKFKLEEDIYKKYLLEIKMYGGHKISFRSSFIYKGSLYIAGNFLFPLYNEKSQIGITNFNFILQYNLKNFKLENALQLTPDKIIFFDKDYSEDATSFFFINHDTLYTQMFKEGNYDNNDKILGKWILDKSNVCYSFEKTIFPLPNYFPSKKIGEKVYGTELRCSNNVGSYNNFPFVFHLNSLQNYDLSNSFLRQNYISNFLDDASNWKMNFYPPRISNSLISGFYQKKDGCFLYHYNVQEDKIISNSKFATIENNKFPSYHFVGDDTFLEIKLYENSIFMYSFR